MAPKKTKEEEAPPELTGPDVGIPEWSDAALAAESFASDGEPFEDPEGLTLPEPLAAAAAEWKRPSEFLAVHLADGAEPCVVTSPDPEAAPARSGNSLIAAAWALGMDRPLPNVVSAIGRNNDSGCSGPNSCSPITVARLAAVKLTRLFPIRMTPSRRSGRLSNRFASRAPRWRCFTRCRRR